MTIEWKWQLTIENTANAKALDFLTQAILIQLKYSHDNKFHQILAPLKFTRVLVTLYNVSMNHLTRRITKSWEVHTSMRALKGSSMRK